MAKQTDIFHGVDVYMYNIDIAPTVFTPEEAKAEYIRLAKIANRRIKTVAASPEFGSSATASHAAFSTAAAGLKTDRQIYAKLQQVARFNARKTSTITGLRQAQAKQLATMREMGYTFLNKGNIGQFQDFWKEVRKHYSNKDFDSRHVVKLYEEAKKKRIDPINLAQDFDFWKKHVDDIDTMKRSNKTMTSGEARERLGLPK